MAEHTEEMKPGGAIARLGGVEGLAAAGPALFAPFAILALSLESGPLWAMGLALAGAAPLAAAAGIASTRPLLAARFALAMAPLALVAAWFAWSTGGPLSSYAPWPFAAIAGMALLGGRVGALLAAALGLAIGAALALLPDPPMRLDTFAPREQRAAVAALSWTLASIGVAAAAWAAVRAWTDALPPLRHPTAAARRALSLTAQGAEICALRIGSTGAVTQVLGAVQETLGLTRDDVRGAQLSGVVHPDDAALLAAMFAQVRGAATETSGDAPPAGPPGVAARLLSPSGGYRWCEARVVAAETFPSPPSGARPDDVVVLIRARWRPDDEIDTPLDKDQSQFLAQVSGALQQTAASVVGYTDVIKSEVFGPLGAESYREHAQSAHSAGTRLKELIDELVDLAHIEAGRLGGDRPLERSQDQERVDPVPLIDGALRQVKSRAERKGVALSVEIAPNMPFLAVDRRAFRRAIALMLLDAVDRGAMGDLAALNVAAEDGLARFAVLTTPRPSTTLVGAEETPRLAAPAAKKPDPFAAAQPGPADPAAEEASDPTGPRTETEVRLGRLVAERLIGRMGGEVMFAGGLGEAAAGSGFSAENRMLYAEAILDAPENADAVAAPNRAGEADVQMGVLSGALDNAVVDDLGDDRPAAAPGARSKPAGHEPSAERAAPATVARRRRLRADAESAAALAAAQTPSESDDLEQPLFDLKGPPRSASAPASGVPAPPEGAPDLGAETAAETLAKTPAPPPAQSPAQSPAQAPAESEVRDAAAMRGGPALTADALDENDANLVAPPARAGGETGRAFPLDTPNGGETIGTRGQASGRGADQERKDDAIDAAADRAAEEDTSEPAPPPSGKRGRAKGAA